MNFITVLKWLKDNDIDIYSTHNKGKSIVAERVIRTLKNKIYKHVTAVLNTMLILLKKNLNLKMVIMLEFQGIKTFLLEDMLQFCWKQFLLLAKLKKKQFHELGLFMTWMVKKLLELFMKKNCKRLIKKNLE